jgi:hypothetical protein
MLKLGTKTKYGEVVCITFKEGERYYMIVDDQLEVSLLPADIVENEIEETKI